MKLSIQHLQRAWNDKVPDWDDRLKRLTNTIVEQIDSLSFIASEFSDFAKMPRSDFEKVDVSTSLTKTIDLFKVSCEYNIKFTIDIIEDCYIYADKKQMLRVFNNLIKNSIQAISNKKDGEILISLFRENDFCIITFKDNGIGIDTSLQSRIFSPYFTTKSGGTGLGLAMVKNIIESMDGKIWFESEKEPGTTFFIQLKLYIE
jgi:signal transduction histidine kinase